MRIVKTKEDDLPALQEKTEIKNDGRLTPGRGRPPKAEHITQAEASEGFAELSNALLVSQGDEDGQFKADDWKKFGKAVSDALNMLGQQGSLSSIIARVLIYAIRFSTGIAEGIHNVRRIIERWRFLKRGDKQEAA